MALKPSRGRDQRVSAAPGSVSPCGEDGLSGLGGGAVVNALVRRVDFLELIENVIGVGQINLVSCLLPSQGRR